MDYHIWEFYQKVAGILLKIYLGIWYMYIWNIHQMKKQILVYRENNWFFHFGLLSLVIARIAWSTCIYHISNLLSITLSVICASIPGVIRRPVTREDEIHNVQCVVDSLAADVLHCDLSHIPGGAVVDGDVMTIQYLLEILDGLVDYVMEQISSETSSDGDGEWKIFYCR